MNRPNSAASGKFQLVFILEIPTYNYRILQIQITPNTAEKLGSTTLGLLLECYCKIID